MLVIVCLPEDVHLKLSVGVIGQGTAMESVSRACVSLFNSKRSQKLDIIWNMQQGKKW